MATVDDLRDALRDERARHPSIESGSKTTNHLQLLLGVCVCRSGHSGTRHQPSDHGRTSPRVLSRMVAPGDCGPARWREGTGQFR